MLLPFFDLTSSAQYVADLLREAEPKFASLSITGSYADKLASQVQQHLPDLEIKQGEQQADVVFSFDIVHTLPAAERAQYVKRIAALAKREAVIAAPLGTELQTTIYRSLEKLALELKLSSPEELALALRHGIPTPQDAASWAHGFTDLDLFYAGDVAYFQEMATQFLYKSAQSPLRRALMTLTSTHATSPAEMPLPPETVPMRRHRRLFLILRKR
ncbi:MAG: hypothetical protein KDB65_03200 [Calditrichaeota bacterium]|nr:hypothetical protein [Calditrichota bacterium]MCB9368670.1 hypothetical protein [Calditrichota bacterium]